MNENEDIISYTVEYSIGTLYVLVGTFDENHKVTSNRMVNLGTEGFDMIMSANPEWSPLKPADNFRKSDLIALINLIG
jgi:dihydrodipicolinate synthase/N-acetylneuraminate lyase